MTLATKCMTHGCAYKLDGFAKCDGGCVELGSTQAALRPAQGGTWWGMPTAASQVVMTLADTDRCNSMDIESTDQPVTPVVAVCYKDFMHWVRREHLDRARYRYVSWDERAYLYGFHGEFIELLRAGHDLVALRRVLGE